MKDLILQRVSCYFKIALCLRSRVMQLQPQLFFTEWACGAHLNPKTRKRRKNVFNFLFSFHGNLPPTRRGGNTTLCWGVWFTLRQMSPAFQRQKKPCSSSCFYIALSENQSLSMLPQISVPCLTSKLSTSSCWLQSSGDQEGIKRTAQFARCL